MNDNIIINAISKIHFIIVSFLSFIFILLCVIFILLQNGLYLESISVANVKIKKLYIKWNEKLNISVEETYIIKKNSQTDTPIKYKTVKKIFKEMVLFDNWFESITLHKIIFNDISGSFRYANGESGYLIASSPEFSLKSTLSYEVDFLNININSFKDTQRNIALSGNILINTQYPEVITSLNIDINNDASLNLYAYLNQKKVFYTLESLKNITDIQHIINLFSLDEAVKYWAYDAIEMSNATLKSAHGWLEYEKMDEAYKNIYIKAVVNDLNYIYNKDVDAIHSKYTILEFKNGILFIYPKEAYTYDFYLDKSWLKIDFTQKEELLTLELLFKGVVNKDLLHLLSTYQINLPFVQNTGSVDTSLQILVNLRTIDVTAKGDFFTQSANFTYLGLNLDINNTYVVLNNYDVAIKDMYVKYKDIMSSVVNVNFDAKESTGVIDFNIEDISFKELDLRLEPHNKPLHAVYRIDKENDRISIDQSYWKFKTIDLSVDPMDVKFDLDTLKAEIPITYVQAKKMGSAYVSGEALLNPLHIDLDVDVLKFAHSGVKLSDTNAPLKFVYDKKVIISSKNDTRFIIDNMEYILAKSTLSIQNNHLNIKQSALQIGNILKTDLSGVYDFNNDTSVIHLNNLNIQNKSLGEIFSNINQTTLQMQYKNKNLTLHSKEFDIDYILNDNSWKLQFNSLNTIAKQSKILNDYNLSEGNFTLYKNVYNDQIHFDADIIYPYHFLVEDDEPLKEYHINGTYGDTINLTVNNSIDVNISKSIHISANQVGVNINDVVKFFNDRNETNSSKSKKPNIILNAKNSYIFVSKNRHIISDTIDLQYYNNITTAQLRYKEGSAGFELENDTFHLHGDKFNDTFMENLFALSKFKNGSLAFSMQGSTQEYEGVFYVTDTIILDYKVLNNILAFVNTIPSLVTFSLPGYNTHGMAVKDAYMHFKAKNNVFEISDIFIDSKELDILGRGSANFNTNTIDLQLNLKTDLGSSISKIPVVGYILLGDDTVSTTLKITGTLEDPKVESLLAEDIIVAPLNIIKRTFLLPYHLITGE